jgi:hypothetical protein
MSFREVLLGRRAPERPLGENAPALEADAALDLVRDAGLLRERVQRHRLVDVLLA